MGRVRRNIETKYLGKERRIWRIKEKKNKKLCRDHDTPSPRGLGTRTWPKVINL